jgi:type VI secretion system secreted protein Hcp
VQGELRLSPIRSGRRRETVSARDLATGRASGKRQHKPVLFTKEWGQASPQLYTALVANEALKQAVFQFVKTNANGEEAVFQTITLTNAAVASIRSYIDLTDTSGAHTTAARSRTYRSSTRRS